MVQLNLEGFTVAVLTNTFAGRLFHISTDLFMKANILLLTLAFLVSEEKKSSVSLVIISIMLILALLVSG
jgi:hypothetical protein